MNKSKVITQPQVPYADLREFHCPNCHAEWISNHKGYEILDVINMEGVGNPGHGDYPKGSYFVTVKSTCPICSCYVISHKNERSIEDIAATYINTINFQEGQERIRKMRNLGISTK